MRRKERQSEIHGFEAEVSVFSECRYFEKDADLTEEARGRCLKCMCVYVCVFLRLTQKLSCKTKQKNKKTNGL